MHTTVNLSDLVSVVGDAVVVSDAAGAITLWNAAAERIFGYSEAEALGRSLDLMIPERMRARHWEGYHHTMATGVTKYGTDVLRVPAIDKAGRSFSIAFTVAMLHGPDGKPNAVAAIIRDDSDRFERDRAQRKRIAELEALLRERGGEPAPAGGAGAGGVQAPQTAPADASAKAADDEPPAGCPMHKPTG